MFGGNWLQRKPCIRRLNRQLVQDWIGDRVWLQEHDGILQTMIADYGEAEEGMQDPGLDPCGRTCRSMSGQVQDCHAIAACVEVTGMMDAFVGEENNLGVSATHAELYKRNDSCNAVGDSQKKCIQVHVTRRFARMNGGVWCSVSAHFWWDLRMDM